MALERSPLVAAQPSTPAPALESEATFDERWAAWQAKGAAHDRAFRRAGGCRAHRHHHRRNHCLRPAR